MKIPSNLRRQVEAQIERNNLVIQIINELSRTTALLQFAAQSIPMEDASLPAGSKVEDKPGEIKPPDLKPTRTPSPRITG